MASITFYVPDQDPLAIPLDEVDQVTIGRGPDNSIVLDHESISGSHAMIQNLEGTFQFTDLDSTNGSYLEGQPVTEVALYHGANLILGKVETVFENEAEAASEPDSVSGGEHYAHHRAELAEASSRPGDFTNLSPLPKIEKKDALAMVAIAVGVVAILAVVAVVAVSFTLSAS